MTHPSEPAASPALTDRAYWRGYWRAKTEQLVAEVPRSLLFHDVFAALLAQAAPRSAIELGGFPGRYSVYLARYFDLDVTLLDFFVDRELLGQIERANGLDPGRVKVIEADVLAYTPERTYDLVYSVGLIEHFTDLEGILAKHLAFLAPAGTLLILLPNLRGVNGVYQRLLDRRNFATHHLECMDLERLERAARSVGFQDPRASYVNRFGVWVQDLGDRSPWVRATQHVVSFLGHAVFRLGPKTSRLGSPFIQLTAHGSG